MRKLLHIFLVLLLVSGCNLFHEQIDELYNEIENLKKTDGELRRQLNEINAQLPVLQQLVTALQSGVYIQSVIPLKENDRQVGYVMTLSNGESLTIRDGEDGVDGHVPAFGVRLDLDGAYYWTVDGEYLYDDQGNKIRADGVTPVFDIRDGYWYVSFDQGVSWKQLGAATGEPGSPGLPGDRIFKRVEYVPGNNVVTFILADDTVITVPCYQAISISFNVPENVTGIMAGETIKVEYTLSYGDDNTVVTASSDGNFIVNVQKKNNTSGSILITCPGLYMDGHVNVMAFDGIGYASISVISFYEKVMTFDSGLEFNMPTEGGTIDIPVHFNFGYYVVVGNQAEEWIDLIQTKAVMDDGRIVANVKKNNGEKRTGKIYIYPDNTTGQPYATIIVNQEAAYFNVDKTSFVFGSAGGSTSASIRSSMELDISFSSMSWLDAALVELEPESAYRLDLTASPNSQNVKRSGLIDIKARMTGRVLATVAIVQLANNGDNEMDMVLEVRVNEGNEFTAYLPVDRTRSDNDFIIDWGDGSYEAVNPSVASSQGNMVYHKYEGVQGSGKTFTVTLSGTITSLTSNHIPGGSRSAIVSVKQWGHTGLTSMRDAFSGCTGLESLPADQTLAFGEVTRFDSAFRDCPRLKTISGHLFDAATKATSFSSVFSNCESLVEIPDRLFSNCVEATSFSNAFSNCKQLASIPEGLFVNCRKIKDFSGTFSHCYRITRIPAGLFSDCPEVTSFSGVFSECDRLISIPADLFWNTPKVESFAHSFYYCSSLVEVPEGLFDHCLVATDFMPPLCPYFTPRRPAAYPAHRTNSVQSTDPSAPAGYPEKNPFRCSRLPEYHFLNN